MMKNLKKITGLMSSVLDPHEPDRIRAFYDALLHWRHSLPRAVHATGPLGPAADILQPLLMQVQPDPLVLLNSSFPDALGEPPLSDQTLSDLQDAICAMNAVTETLIEQTIEMTRRIFNQRIGKDALSLNEAVEKWTDAIPLSVITGRGLDHEARGVLSRAKQVSSTRTGEHGFVSALSGIFLGLGFDAWEENSFSQYCDRLEVALNHIEELALEQIDDSTACEPFIKNRLSALLAKFVTRIGPERLWQYLEEVQVEKT